MAALVDGAALVEYLHLGTADLDDATEVATAVSALVASYHDQPDGDWPADLRLGAKMLAARVYRRRNSPAGVESLGELGPVYVSRNDPDLSQLLRLGRYHIPRVG